MRTYRPVPRFEPLGWLVAAVEPAATLVVHEPARAGAINSSWAFVLEGDGQTHAAAVTLALRRRGVAHRLFTSTRPTSSWRPVFCRDSSDALSGGRRR